MKNLNTTSRQLNAVRSNSPDQRVSARVQLLLPLLSTLGIGLPAAAQDLDSIMPEPVPPQVEADSSALPEPSVSTTGRLHPQTLGAQPDEQRLLDKLVDVVLLEDESDLNSSASSIRANRLDSPELWAITNRFVGLPVSRQSIDRMMMAIRLQLSSEGKPFSLVYTPPQDITDGVIRIVIKPSLTGQIRVEGAHYFSEDSYLSRLRQQSGTEINAQALNEDIERINRNPFRAAAVRVEKGSEPATTDIVLQTRERDPLRVFVGYNNAGSQVTTMDRMTAGVNWGNAFGLGHQASLQWTSDFDAEHSRSISGNYQIDLPWRHYLTLFAAYSRINAITDPLFNQEGKSWQMGLNYEIPLNNIGKDYTQSLILGLDSKASDNTLELSLPPLIIPISDNLTRILQVRARYQGTWTDDISSTRLGAQLTVSPGDAGSDNNDESFQKTRAGATADYVYANLDLSRNTRLAGVFEGWDWMVRGAAQRSSANLLSSEQFSAGGSNSVRGYEESEVVGDNALLFSQELILPSMTPAQQVFSLNRQESLRFYLFQDIARTRSTQPLTGEKAFILHSMGTGLRYQLFPNLNAQISYGWQLRNSGSNDSGDHGRLHVSIQASY
jgi:hemolysin activation/secretion protein